MGVEKEKGGEVEGFIYSPVISIRPSRNDARGEKTVNVWIETKPSIPSSDDIEDDVKAPTLNVSTIEV